jgi:hypothetical protein
VRVRREVSRDAGTKRGVACRSAHVPSPAAQVTIGRQCELAVAATHVHVRFPSLRGARNVRQFRQPISRSSLHYAARW